MLKKLILIFTQDYKRTWMNSKDYNVFLDEMALHGTEVCLYGKEDVGEKRIGNKKDLWETQEKGCLFFSDDAKMLLQLQEEGKYTVAVYHEGVSGLLGGTQFAMEGMSDVDWNYLYKVYQRFEGEPWKITETDRCSIREMVPSDVDALYELYAGPNVTRYMEGLFSEKEQEEQYIREYIENVYKYYDFGTWLIHKKDDGKLIGRAGFNYRPGYEEVELGFVIAEECWRQGYGFEVCSKLMDLAGEVYEFECVQALVKKENEASIRLLEKLGFQYMEETEFDGDLYQRYLAKLAL